MDTGYSDRFWSKVAVAGPDECWLWTAGLLPGGYGQFHVKGRMKLAHRVAYELSSCHRADGLVVMHSCDVRKCCNPAHLSPGTQAINMRDMVCRGRSLIGSRNRQAVLSEADVVAIRAAYASGCVSYRLIADQFGVSKRQVGRIINLKSWANTA